MLSSFKSPRFKQLAAHAVMVTERMVLYADTNGQILEANPSACKKLGYTHSEIVNLSISAFDPYFSIEDFDDFRTIFRQDGVSEVCFETEYVTSTGESFPVEIQVTLSELEGEEVFVGLATDISDRVNVNHKLQAQSQRAQYFLDIVDLIVVALDRQGNITLINRQGCELLGDVESNLLEKNWFKHFTPSDQIDEVFKVFEQLMLGEMEFVSRYESPIVTCSGDLRLVAWHNTLLYDSEGSIEGVLASGKDITLERQRSEDLHFFQQLVNQSHDPMYCLSPSEGYRMVYANKAACEHFGYSEEQLYQLTVFDWDKHVNEASISALMLKLENAGDEPIVFESEHYRADRTLIPVEISANLVEHNGTDFIVGYIRNITARRESEQQLRDARDKAQLLLDSSKEGVFGIDLNGEMSFVNQMAAELLGYSVDELVGRNNHKLVHHSTPSGEHLAEEDCRMMQAALSGKTYHVDTECLWRRDGSYFPVEYWSSPIYQQGEITGAVVSFHDISERKEAEKQIRHLAFRDPLTGLPNRRLFVERLEYELAQCRRNNDSFMLFLLDLDHFKEVNDTLGHPVGDELLRQVSQRIQSLMREVDTFARIGGDEFAIIQTNLYDPAKSALLAQKILEQFQIPFNLNGRTLNSATSIGLAMGNQHSQLDDLMSCCDVALYLAKEHGRSHYIFYEKEMAEKVQQEADVARQIKASLSEGRFHLVYQPQFDLEKGLLSGVESLLRWQNDAKEWVSPEVFIPICERRGLMPDVGLWVLGEVIQQITEWQSLGLCPDTVAVNISPMQLQKGEDSCKLKEMIELYSSVHSVLEIEITETTYMEVSEDVRSLLKGLAVKGIRFAIDDFGTGYSSLVSLRSFPADFLKIDTSFVRDMSFDTDDAVIVESIIALAHALGKTVIAEGVETDTQYSMLKEMGCDQVQGFLTGRPMKAAEIERLMLKQL